MPVLFILTKNFNFSLNHTFLELGAQKIPFQPKPRSVVWRKPIQMRPIPWSRHRSILKKLVCRNATTGCGISIVNFILGPATTLNTLFCPLYLHRLAGRFYYERPDERKNTTIAYCSDGTRPVIFKIEWIIICCIRRTKRDSRTKRATRMRLCYSESRKTFHSCKHNLRRWSMQPM